MTPQLSLYYAWSATKLPASLANLAFRLFRKEESISTALQRLGWATVDRRNGPLIWYHTTGLGDCALALPLVFRSLQEYNEKVSILITTSTVETYYVLRDVLPQRVLVQVVPLDNPLTIHNFLSTWKPQIGIFLETPFHHELALMATAAGCTLALLNAHLPGDDVLSWHVQPASRRLLGRMLAGYSLIVPRSDVDVGRFRIFGATMTQMPGWSMDLQHAAALGAPAWQLWQSTPETGPKLQRRLAKRLPWLAANVTPSEEEVCARLHIAVKPQCAALLTIIAPCGPLAEAPAEELARFRQQLAELADRLSARHGLLSAMASDVLKQNRRLPADVDVLLLDDPGLLLPLYTVCEVSLVGGSVVPDPSATCVSPAAAAVAGCALLMGPNAGPYEAMAAELNEGAVLAWEEAAAAVNFGGALHHMAAAEDGAVAGQDDGAAHGRPATAASQSAEAGPAQPGNLWCQLVSDVQRQGNASRPMSAPPAAPGGTAGSPQPGQAQYLTASFEAHYATEDAAADHCVGTADRLLVWEDSSRSRLCYSPDLGTSLGRGEDGRWRPDPVSQFRWSSCGYDYDVDVDSVASLDGDEEDRTVEDAGEGCLDASSTPSDARRLRRTFSNGNDDGGRAMPSTSNVLTPRPASAFSPHSRAVVAARPRTTSGSGNRPGFWVSPGPCTPSDALWAGDARSRQYGRPMTPPTSYAVRGTPEPISLGLGPAAAIGRALRRPLSRMGYGMRPATAPSPAAPGMPPRGRMPQRGQPDDVESRRPSTAAPAAQPGDRSAVRPDTSASPRLARSAAADLRCPVPATTSVQLLAAEDQLAAHDSDVASDDFFDAEDDTSLSAPSDEQAELEAEELPLEALAAPPDPSPATVFTPATEAVAVTTPSSPPPSATCDEDSVWADESLDSVAVGAGPDVGASPSRAAAASLMRYMMPSPFMLPDEGLDQASSALMCLEGSSFESLPLAVQYGSDSEGCLDEDDCHSSVTLMSGAEVASGNILREGNSSHMSQRRALAQYDCGSGHHLLNAALGEASYPESYTSQASSMHGVVIPTSGSRLDQDLDHTWSSDLHERGSHHKPPLGRSPLSLPMVSTMPSLESADTPQSQSTSPSTPDFHFPAGSENKTGLLDSGSPTLLAPAPSTLDSRPSTVPRSMSFPARPLTAPMPKRSSLSQLLEAAHQAAPGRAGDAGTGTDQHPAGTAMAGAGAPLPRTAHLGNIHRSCSAHQLGSPHSVAPAPGTLAIAPVSPTKSMASAMAAATAALAAKGSSGSSTHQEVTVSLPKLPMAPPCAALPALNAGISEAVDMVLAPSSPSHSCAGSSVTNSSLLPSPPQLPVQPRMHMLCSPESTASEQRDADEDEVPGALPILPRRAGSSSNSQTLPKVASVSSWLGELGLSLSKAEARAARGQVQANPWTWFQKECAGCPTGSLENIAGGLRAPLHTPLRGSVAGSYDTSSERTRAFSEGGHSSVGCNALDLPGTWQAVAWPEAAGHLDNGSTSQADDCGSIRSSSRAFNSSGDGAICDPCGYAAASGGPPRRPASRLLWPMDESKGVGVPADAVTAAFTLTASPRPRSASSVAGSGAGGSAAGAAPEWNSPRVVEPACQVANWISISPVGGSPYKRGESEFDAMLASPQSPVPSIRTSPPSASTAKRAIAAATGAGAGASAAAAAPRRRSEPVISATSFLDDEASIGNNSHGSLRDPTNQSDRQAVGAWLQSPRVRRSARTVLSYEQEQVPPTPREREQLRPSTAGTWPAPRGAAGGAAPGSPPSPTASSSCPDTPRSDAVNMSPFKPGIVYSGTAPPPRPQLSPRAQSVPPRDLSTLFGCPGTQASTANMVATLDRANAAVLPGAGARRSLPNVPNGWQAQGAFQWVELGNQQQPGASAVASSGPTAPCAVTPEAAEPTGSTSSDAATATSPRRAVRWSNMRSSFQNGSPGNPAGGFGSEDGGSNSPLAKLQADIDAMSPGLWSTTSTATTTSPHCPRITLSGTHGGNMPMIPVVGPGFELESDQQGHLHRLADMTRTVTLSAGMAMADSASIAARGASSQALSASSGQVQAQPPSPVSRRLVQSVTALGSPPRQHARSFSSQNLADEAVFDSPVRFARRTLSAGNRGGAFDTDASENAKPAPRSSVPGSPRTMYSSPDPNDPTQSPIKVAPTDPSSSLHLLAEDSSDPWVSHSPISAVSSDGSMPSSPCATSRQMTPQADPRASPMKPSMPNPFSSAAAAQLAAALRVRHEEAGDSPTGGSEEHEDPSVVLARLAAERDQQRLRAALPPMPATLPNLLFLPPQSGTGTPRAAHRASAPTLPLSSGLAPPGPSRNTMPGTPRSSRAASQGSSGDGGQPVRTARRHRALEVQASRSGASTPRSARALFQSDQPFGRPAGAAAPAEPPRTRLSSTSGDGRAPCSSVPAKQIIPFFEPLSPRAASPRGATLAPGRATWSTVPHESTYPLLPRNSYGSITTRPGSARVLFSEVRLVTLAAPVVSEQGAAAACSSSGQLQRMSQGSVPLVRPSSGSASRSQPAADPLDSMLAGMQVAVGAQALSMSSAAPAASSDADVLLAVRPVSTLATPRPTDLAPLPSPRNGLSPMASPMNSPVPTNLPMLGMALAAELQALQLRSPRLSPAASPVPAMSNPFLDPATFAPLAAAAAAAQRASGWRAPATAPACEIQPGSPLRCSFEMPSPHSGSDWHWATMGQAAAGGQGPLPGGTTTAYHSPASAFSNTAAGVPTTSQWQAVLNAAGIAGGAPPAPGMLTVAVSPRAGMTPTRRQLFSEGSLQASAWPASNACSASPAQLGAMSCGSPIMEEPAPSLEEQFAVVEQVVGELQLETRIPTPTAAVTIAAFGLPQQSAADAARPGTAPNPSLRHEPTLTQPLRMLPIMPPVAPTFGLPTPSPGTAVATPQQPQARQRDNAAGSVSVPSSGAPAPAASTKGDASKPPSASTKAAMAMAATPCSSSEATLQYGAIASGHDAPSGGTPSSSGAGDGVNGTPAVRGGRSHTSSSSAQPGHDAFGAAGPRPTTACSSVPVTPLLPSAAGGSPGLGAVPLRRYRGQFLLPAGQLPCGPRNGPAVWTCSSEEEMAAALTQLLKDPVERRSRGHAAAQGAAKLASSLVGAVWGVLDESVVTPALHKYLEQQQQERERHQQAAAHAARPAQPQQPSGRRWW